MFFKSKKKRISAYPNWLLSLAPDFSKLYASYRYIYLAYYQAIGIIPSNQLLKELGSYLEAVTDLRIRRTLCRRLTEHPPSSFMTDEEEAVISIMRTDRPVKIFLTSLLCSALAGVGMGVSGFIFTERLTESITPAFGAFIMWLFGAVIFYVLTNDMILHVRSGILRRIIPSRYRQNYGVKSGEDSSKFVLINDIAMITLTLIAFVAYWRTYSSIDMGYGASLFSSIMSLVIVYGATRYVTTSAYDKLANRADNWLILHKHSFDQDYQELVRRVGYQIKPSMIRSVSDRLKKSIENSEAELRAATEKFYELHDQTVYNRDNSEDKLQEDRAVDKLHADLLMQWFNSSAEIDSPKWNAYQSLHERKTLNQEISIEDLDAVRNLSPYAD